MNDLELTQLRARVQAITRPEKGLLFLYFLTSLLAFVAFPFVFVPLFFRYETLRYRFDDEGVFMSYGILFRREMQLTYARMQDIHLSQNIIERWLDIGTVTIQTAGSGSASNMAITGVKHSEQIRDYLYAKMRGIHLHEQRPAHAVNNEAVLRDIRDALRDAATALQRPRA